MKLNTRIERLERLAKIVSQTPPYFRYGWLKGLPRDYVGERHVAIITREPTGSPYMEWCQFEERVGPAPNADSDNAFRLYLTPEEGGT